MGAERGGAFEPEEDRACAGGGDGFRGGVASAAAAGLRAGGAGSAVMILTGGIEDADGK